jgi:hypothetical protein
MTIKDICYSTEVYREICARYNLNKLELEYILASIALLNVKPIFTRKDLNKFVNRRKMIHLTRFDDARCRGTIESLESKRFFVFVRKIHTGTQYSLGYSIVKDKIKLLEDSIKDIFDSCEDNYTNMLYNIK